MTQPETFDYGQPAPIPNDHGPIGLMVMADMAARMEQGKATYGTYLQPFNGRDALQDLYEELLDACVYLRQLIEERRIADRMARALLSDEEEV